MMLVTDRFLDVCLKIKLSQTDCVEKYLDETLHLFNILTVGTKKLCKYFSLFLHSEIDKW